MKPLIIQIWPGWVVICGHGQMHTLCLDAYQGRFDVAHSPQGGSRKDEHRQEKNLISIDFYVQVWCLNTKQAQAYSDAEPSLPNCFFTAREWDLITWYNDKKRCSIVLICITDTNNIKMRCPIRCMTLWSTNLDFWKNLGYKVFINFVEIPTQYRVGNTLSVGLHWWIESMMFIW